MKTIYLEARIDYNDKIRKVYLQTLDRKHKYILTGQDLQLIKIQEVKNK